MRATYPILNYTQEKFCKPPKTSESKLTLTLSEYYALMSQLMLLEKSLDELNKLDKLYKIEKSMHSMNNRIIDFEQRLKHTENSSKEFEKSVSV
jgi:hypothetical protein